jgi:phosphoribosylanthranilate isomerase
MSIWVKICGTTSLADAQLAADAGADAIGFVFAPSPRRITAEQAAAITPHLPVALEKIGVFVDADFTTIATAVERAGLTGVQLHAGHDLSLAAQLRVRFGPNLRILGVIHFGRHDGPVDGPNLSQQAQQLAAAQTDGSIDAVLVDSRTATAAGGTGIAFDWQAARAQLFTGQSPLRLIAAGGLDAENVAEAIATLQPWGVDVVTGVEASPGRKDPDKVRAFIGNARTP